MGVPDNAGAPSPGRYDPHEIERRWRARWESDPVGEVDLDAVEAGDIFYNLAEFPYPSAEGLHIGHVFKYSGVDVYGRYQRMCGRAVFQPMGFDAFGIHSENFALRAGEHPRELTVRTTAAFREQLTRAGMAWDWRVSVDTSQPEYYRWTQWVFLRLFEAGLAYRAEAPVVWCPSCMTVLANEQTEQQDGRSVCERCATEVTERVMRQWFLRITAYADRLLDGLDGLDWPERAKRLQRAWIGREEVVGDDGRPTGERRYRLHDWLISRQRYWGPPIPIVHCPSCGEVAVPDAELPVVLPDVEDFRPTGTGESPLAADEDWVRTSCPACGGPARRETDVSDTFFDSSWYFLRYPSADRADVAWDDDRTRRFLPVNFYAGGPEHVQRHHLYARFVTMALHDLGLVPFEEPFPRIRLGGLIVHAGAKMSKSRGNVLRPEPWWDRVGVDAFRVALLFLAPWEDGGEFNEGAVAGAERFLAKVWRAVVDRPADGGATSEGVASDGPDPAAAAVIAAVTRAVESLRFNVAIARLMSFVPKVRSEDDRRTLVLLLAPFAPHLAEELWSRIGGAGSVHHARWPATSTDDYEAASARKVRR